MTIARVRGLREDGGVEWESTLADFLESNRDDEDTCTAVRALGVGEHVDVGGGAVAFCRVERVS